MFRFLVKNLHFYCAIEKKVRIYVLRNEKLLGHVVTNEFESAITEIVWSWSDYVHTPTIHSWTSGPKFSFPNFEDTPSVIGKVEESEFCDLEEGSHKFNDLVELGEYLLVTKNNIEIPLDRGYGSYGTALDSNAIKSTIEHGKFSIMFSFYGSILNKTKGMLQILMTTKTYF